MQANLAYPCVYAADPVALIKQIRNRNMKAGVAISPDTPSSTITDEIGHLADMLLVMTVYPGPSSFLWSHLCGEFLTKRTPSYLHIEFITFTTVPMLHR